MKDFVNSLKIHRCQEYKHRNTKSVNLLTRNYCRFSTTKAAHDSQMQMYLLLSDCNKYQTLKHTKNGYDCTNDVGIGTIEL